MILHSFGYVSFSWETTIKIDLGGTMKRHKPSESINIFSLPKSNHDSKALTPWSKLQQKLIVMKELCFQMLGLQEVLGEDANVDVETIKDNMDL